MKILRIIASADLADGGPIEGSLRVGEALATLGHSQELMTLDPVDSPLLGDGRAPVHATGRPISAGLGGMIDRLGARLRYTPGAVPWLKAHLADYDVAIVSGLWNYATLAARRALVGGSTPYVVFTHGMLDPWFNRTYPLKAAAKQVSWLFSEGPLLRHASAVLFTTQEERERARGAFFPYRAKERVVSYGTADAPEDADAQRAAFQEAFPVLAGHRFLLFLSRIHEKKGCDLLIEAFGTVASRNPDLHLVMAGPDQSGLVESLSARAQALGVGDRVHWPGMLGGTLKWGAYRCCDAFILPSHQENFGIVVAEAMACGKPVLTTDKVNIWREIEEFDAGIVCTDDLHGTLALIERYLDLSSEMRAAMGQRARQCFLTRFTIEQAARDLEAVLLEATTCAAASPLRSQAD